MRFWQTGRWHDRGASDGVGGGVTELGEERDAAGGVSSSVGGKGITGAGDGVDEKLAVDLGGV